MQLAASNLIDCVSARDLLQALNTLQQIKQQAVNQFQLSFSQSSNSLFGASTNNANQIDFQMYMAMKNQKTKQTKAKTQTGKKAPVTGCKSYMTHDKNNDQHKKVEITPRKTHSPISNKFASSQDKFTSSKQQIARSKDRSIERTHMSVCRQSLPEIKQIKSRSHSPIHSKRNPVCASKATPSVAFSSVYTSKKQKNPEPVQPEVTPKVKVSMQSKKILMDKQNRGESYVPIYERTSQLIKAKQEKIQKIQKLNLTQKQIEQKQCTFRPSINAYKKPLNKQSLQARNRHRAHLATETNYDNERSFNEVSLIRESASGRQEEPLREKNHDNVPAPKHDDMKKKQKPKNAKFNILLDLIH